MQIDRTEKEGNFVKSPIQILFSLSQGGSSILVDTETLRESLQERALGDVGQLDWLGGEWEACLGLWWAGSAC